MNNREERLPLVNSYIELWAKKTPKATAMIQHEDGRSFSYKKFTGLVDFFALKLLDMGIRKGDTVATLLVLVPEHMMLMYACFKIGAIIAPLDVRLKDDEVVRDVDKIKAKAFFFLGNTPVRDFRTAGEAVKKHCPYVEHFIQFTPEPKPGELMDGAVGITDMMDKKKAFVAEAEGSCYRRTEKSLFHHDHPNPRAHHIHDRHHR